MKKFLSEHFGLIASIGIPSLAMLVLALANWTSFTTLIEISKEDNLILRSLFSDRIFLGAFRLFSIAGIIIITLASCALLIKIFRAAVVNLWGLEIRSETLQFQTELGRKDETINRLESENMKLSGLLDILSEIVEGTKEQKAQRRQG